MCHHTQAAEYKVEAGQTYCNAPLAHIAAGKALIVVGEAGGALSGRMRIA